MTHYIKQLFCKHAKELIRWHWVHYPECEPISVEVEYKCKICEKYTYLHLYDADAEEYAEYHKDTQAN